LETANGILVWVNKSSSVWSIKCRKTPA